MIGSLIWFIIVAITIANVVGKFKNAQKRDSRNRQQNVPAAYQAAAQEAKVQMPDGYQTPARNAVYRQQAVQQGSGTQQRVVTDEDRARLEAYRRKKAGSNAYVPSKPVQTKQNLNVNRQRNVLQPDIVERAKANSQKYAKDETLHELESRHGHSERVGSAVAGYVEREREEHRRMHEEPMPGVEEISLLGSVEDLMVKGYSGSLSFERDFIGEAADMLAAFTMSE